MDYTKETLRLFKKTAAGTEVYNISIQMGMIAVESGPMGKRPHRINHPLAEKPRVDKLVQSLIEKGYAPLDKTFAPFAAVRSAQQVAQQAHQVQQAKKSKRFVLGGGFGG